MFNPEHGEDYDEFTYYDIKEPYNTSMLNTIDSIELTDFISSGLSEDVQQIDILYKQENSNVVYSIASIGRGDEEWHSTGSSEGADLGLTASDTDKPAVLGGLHKGKYVINSENIKASFQVNQLLRSCDNVPRKAVA